MTTEPLPANTPEWWAQRWLANASPEEIEAMRRLLAAEKEGTDDGN